MNLNKHKTFFLNVSITILIIIGIFIRTSALSSLPQGLWFDEGINGIDGYYTSKGDIKLFYIRNENAREPLYIYVIGVIFKFLPPTIYSLRLSSALLNILSLFVSYKLFRLFFNKKWSVVSLLFLTFFRWHFHFGRLAFRVQSFSLIFLLTIYFLTKYFKTANKKYLFLSSFFAGLSFYTYLSARFLPIWIVILLFIFELFQKKSRENMIKSIGIFTVTYFILTLPLAIFFIHHPDYFFWRIKEVSIFSNTDNPIKELFINFLKGFSGYIYHGDIVWQHNYKKLPIFVFPFNIFFIIGLFYISFKGNFYTLQLLAWFFMAIIITALSTKAPNFLRMSFFAPLSIIILVNGFKLVYEYLTNTIKKQYLTFFISALIVIYFIFQNLYIYYLWGRDREIIGRFNYDTVHLCKICKKLSKQYNIYVPEIIYNHPSFQFLCLKEKNKILPLKKIRDKKFYLVYIKGINFPYRNYIIKSSFEVISIKNFTWAKILLLEKKK